MKKQICSLIYREWCIMKKSFILGGIAVLSIMIIMLMFLLSAKYGNLSKEIAGDKTALSYLGEAGSVMVTFLLPYCSFAVAVDAAIYKSDIKAGWVRYSIALPVSTKTRALAHTLFIAVRMAAAFVFSLITVLVIRAAAGASFSVSLLADMGIIGVMTLLIEIFTEFVQSLPKDEIMLKKQQAKGSVVIIAIGIAIGLYFSKITMNSYEEFAGSLSEDSAVHYFPPELIEKYTSFRSAIAPFLLPLIILMFAAVYFIVKTNLDRQKKI